MPSIEEYYEDYWEDPESYNDPTVAERQSLIRRHAPELTKDSSVLDVGCGRGEFCHFFIENYQCKAIGCDLSRTGIEYAKKQYPDIDFHASTSSELLPEFAQQIDLVFSSEVIEHLFDVGEYLTSINQLLKPGGSFILTTPYHGHVKNIAVDLMNYAKHYDPEGQHIRFFNRKSLVGCLEKYGFEVLTVTGYGRPWPFWKSFFIVAKKIGPAPAT